MAENAGGVTKWVNELVKAGKPAKTGLVPLIPIKNDERLSRVPFVGGYGGGEKRGSALGKRVSRGSSGVGVSSGDDAGSSSTEDLRLSGKPVGAGKGPFGERVPSWF